MSPPRRAGEETTAPAENSPQEAPARPDRTGRRPPAARRATSAGGRIRRARLLRGLSLRSLALRLEISAAYLSDIETDRRAPAEAVIERLALSLGMDADALAAAFGRLSPPLRDYLAQHPDELAALRRKARAWQEQEP